MSEPELCSVLFFDFKTVENASQRKFQFVFVSKVSEIVPVSFELCIYINSQDVTYPQCNDQLACYSRFHSCKDISYPSNYKYLTQAYN